MPLDIVLLLAGRVTLAILEIRILALLHVALLFLSVPTQFTIQPSLRTSKMMRTSISACCSTAVRSAEKSMLGSVRKESTAAAASFAVPATPTTSSKRTPTVSNDRTSKSTIENASTSSSSKANATNQKVPAKAEKIGQFRQRGDGVTRHESKLRRNKHLSLIQAMSLFHQTSDFPDFRPSPSNESSSTGSSIYASHLPLLPVNVNSYIYSKLHHDPTAPLQIGRARPTPQRATTATSLDPHAYMNDGERNNFSIAGIDNTPFAMARASEEAQKWEAFGSDSTREMRTRARRMVDALFGTVDARQPGPEMVKDVVGENARLEKKRQAQSAGGAQNASTAPA